MAKGYMPRSTEEFLEWGRSFLTQLKLRYERVGLTLAQVEQFEAKWQDFEAKYEAHAAAVAALKAATAAKNETRKKLDSLIRPMIKRILANPNVTDAQRIGLGLPTSKKKYRPSFLRTGSTPRIFIKIGDSRDHTLTIFDERRTGMKPTKPADALGCEIYQRVGGPSFGYEGMKLIGLATRKTFVVQYDEGDAGKQAHYAAKWINRKNEKSSWGHLASATICEVQTTGFADGAETPETVSPSTSQAQDMDIRRAA